MEQQETGLKRGPKPKIKTNETVSGDAGNPIKFIETTGIQALIDIGIPLKMVRFHQAVLSFGNAADANGTPEIALYASIQRLSRKANMWYTPHGLVIEQRKVYKIIPLPQVADTIVL